MTYQPPPVVPGPAMQPPNGDWTPPKPKSRAPILIGVAALLVLVVAGLGVTLVSGGDKPAAKGPAASTSAAAEAKPERFGSGSALRQTLFTNGVACLEPETVTHDGKGPVGLIDDTISCHKGGAELDIDIYDTPANASGRVAYQAALLEGLGLDPAWFAVGENWTVQCETRADCEAVTAAIGGRVEATGPAKATTAPATSAAPKPKPITYAKITPREWKKLAKNPDAYAGKAYIVYGAVTQFDTATGDDTFRANVDGVRHSDRYDYDTNTILTNVAGDVSDLVEDDMFQANVIVVGSYEYETTLGGNMTVPMLNVMKIKRVK